MKAIKQRLAKVHIVYPVPNRMPLEGCIRLIEEFLTIRTGGRRLQGVSAALLDTIGARFGLFSQVRTGNINRADAAAGDVADLDCVDDHGQTVLAVEVKDRHLTIREIEDKLPMAHERGVAEIIYLIRGEVEPARRSNYAALQDREFAAGHNIYDVTFDSLLRVTLMLVGESGRRDFLLRVGQRMDDLGELADRQAWREAMMPE